MAGYFNLTDLILIDRWPGAVNPNLGIPTGGWDNTTDNFVETAASTPLPGYPVGTKISAYTDNSYAPGNYTMMYLNYHCYSSTNSLISPEDISLGTAWCFHYEGSDAVKYGVETSVVPYYVVTCCYTAAISDASWGSPVAIPCASISAGESSAAQVSTYGDSYGWFWVGGVCPCADATFLQGTGSAAMGPDISCDTLCARGPVQMEMSGTIGFLMNTEYSILTDTSVISASTPWGGLFNPLGYLCTSCVA
jgi:hypothetical protein